jgi:hypothetical protein
MTTYALVHGAWHGAWCWTAEHRPESSSVRVPPGPGFLLEGHPSERHEGGQLVRFHTGVG